MMSADTHTAAREVLEIIPLVMRTVAAELRRAGQAPSHFRLLAMLAHRASNLSELAEKHAVSLPTMSNTISTLVERGWVKRTQAAHDRRQVLIELTPAGRTVLAAIRRQAEAHVAELLAPLSQSERKTLLAGLAILREVFEASVPTHEGSPYLEKN